MHGGRGTGPRTLAGLKAVVAAKWKHGRYSGIERETAVVVRQVADAVRRAIPFGPPCGGGRQSA